MKRARRLICFLLAAAMLAGMVQGVLAADQSDGNLAREKTAFASEGDYVDNAQWNLASLTDGKKLITSNYAANAGFHSKGKKNPLYVGIDLGSEQTFNQICVYPRIDDQTGGQLLNWLVDFEIQVSSDSNSWTTVRTITGNTNAAREPQIFEFVSQTAKYIRLAITQATGGGTTFAVSELEVYNRSETPVQLTDAEILGAFTQPVFSDDFSDQTASNGKWTTYVPSAANGIGTLSLGGKANIGSEPFGDAVFCMKMSVSGADWIGLLFNRTDPAHIWDNSGYLLYLRSNGTVEIISPTDQSFAYQTASASEDYAAGSFVDFKVVNQAGSLKVYRNNILILEAEGLTQTSGYAGFFVSGTTGSGALDDVKVYTKPYENQIDSYLEKLNTVQILRDDTQIRFPELPAGHSLTILSSDHSEIIGTNGTVVPPKEETAVTLKIKVSCTSLNAEHTKDLTYTVPRKSTADDISFAQAAEYGLFAHYVWSGRGEHSAIDENGSKPTSVDQVVKEFNVGQFVSDCEDFGVQYVVFTAWHARMNPLYHSEVFRKWRGNAADNPSENAPDILMQLADGLAEKGIDLYFYTHPNDLHDFSDEDKAKFNYKSQGDTTFNYSLWNEYLVEQYTELCERYKGKFKGFFIDEGLGSPANDAFVDYTYLRAAIKTVDPSLILIQNWSEVAGKGKYLCDTGMVEDRIQTSYGAGDWGDSLKTSITGGSTWPSFGLSFAARIGERPMNWTAQYNKDGTFTGSDTADFQDKKLTLASAEDLFRYTVYQAASNIEGLGVCWAAGPYRSSDGADSNIWEPGVRETMTKVGSYLKPIRESVLGTKPSSSWPAKIDVNPAAPRVKTGCLGDVTYVAMQSIDGNRQFVHVLNPGKSGVSGNTLTLPAPADEAVYQSAWLVKDKTQLTLTTQADGSIFITLPDNVTWDPLDTAIELSGTAPADPLDYPAFSDDFSDQSATNEKWLNAPSIVNGAAKIGLGGNNKFAIKGQTFDEAVYEFDLSAGNAHWAGMIFNSQTPTDTWDESGYMLYLRSGTEAGTTAGAVDLMRCGGSSVRTTLASAQISGFTGTAVHFKIRYMAGGKITIWGNGSLLTTVTDTTWQSGYAGFCASGVSGCGYVDNVTVHTRMPEPDDEEAIRTAFAQLKTGLAASRVYIDSDVINNLPQAPLGYSYHISASSNEAVISADGIVMPPECEETVTVTYQLIYTFLGDQKASDTCEVTYTVKKATTTEDIAFFQNAKYGAFVHYVWPGVAYTVTARYPDGKTAESIDEMIENFNAEQFAQDCADWGMQYVIFTVWHARMNPVYHSNVYEEWRDHTAADVPTDDNDHDLILKVYNALHAKGIDLYLYTHPYDLHDLTEADRTKFGYKSLGDLTFDYDKWNDYLNAQYKELCERYQGKIKGMFVDEGLPNVANNLAVDYPRLRDTVKSVDPTLIMIQNEYHGKYSCDTSMWELPTAWHGGEYNNINTWKVSTLPIGTSVGHIYRGYSWWAQKNRGAGTDGLETSDNIFRYTVLEAAANTEGGGIAWAIGPYCGSDSDGIWEDGIKERLSGVRQIMQPIEQSIKNTRPSKAYPFAAYSTFASVTWGVATESADGSRTYLHVLKPEAASGNMLTIEAPANNAGFTKAYLLKDNTSVAIEQQADGRITLTLPDGVEWDRIDTVIVLSDDQSDPAVEAVKALIEKIGVVTRESKARINAARAAYDALSDAQKQLVDNYNVLLAAEEAYKALLHSQEPVTPAVSATITEKLPFVDVSHTDWFYDAVCFVYQNGLMNGTAPKVFAPYSTVTRGMLVTILWRMEEEPSVKAETRFADVKTGTYYEKAIAWAAETGIVTGYGNTRFGADDAITREQMAAILFRYAKHKGYDTDGATVLSQFADHNTLSSYAVQPMAWAVSEGYFTGKQGSVLAPLSYLTRAEAATLLLRFLRTKR